MIKKSMTFVFFFCTFALYAQTATEMDLLLETNEVSAATAAYFTLGAAGLLQPGLSGTEAFTTAYDTARSRGWVNTAANEAVTLQETAFLLMNAFELKGGVMYSLFPNPRYAYRELLYHKLIQGRSYYNMRVSGIELLRIIDRTFSYSGGDGESN